MASSVARFTSFGRLWPVTISRADVVPVRVALAPSSFTDLDTGRVGQSVTGSTILLPFVMAPVRSETGLEVGNGRPEEKFNAKAKPSRAQ